MARDTAIAQFDLRSSEDALILRAESAPRDKSHDKLRRHLWIYLAGVSLWLGGALIAHLRKP